jgi:hypothetical protein
MFGADSMIGVLDSLHTEPLSVSQLPRQPLLRDDDENEVIPAEQLAMLHSNYFDTIYYSLPWLNKDRFRSEFSTNTESPALLSLSYAIALLGCTLSPKLSCLEQPCYNSARKYAEICERDQEDGHLANLNLFQALLFIVRYEIRHRRPLRAWMTIGRLIRLSKLVGLHQIDREPTRSSTATDLRACLAPTNDEVILEERRRCFWALYMVC